MEVCKYNHDEIVYSSNLSCPMCKLLDEMHEKEDELNEMQKDIECLEDQINELKQSNPELFL